MPTHRSHNSNPPTYSRVNLGQRYTPLRKTPALTHVPIIRKFQSRKSIFNYCVDRIVARLHPMWQGSRRSLRHAVRNFLMPRRRTPSFMGRVVQTLHTAIVAAILIATLKTQTAQAHERTIVPVPIFVGVTEPTGLTDVGLNSDPSIGDFNSDGKPDVISGQDDGTIEYFLNTGTVIAPEFIATTVPTGLTGTASYSMVTSIDLDGDGDLGVLVNQVANPFVFFKNTGSAITPEFMTSTLSGLTDFGSYVGASFGDVDGDGDLDLLIGNGNIVYLENSGSVTNPLFAATATMTTIPQYDSSSTPVLDDLDGDGDLDFLAGNADGDFVYFENCGSATLPDFSSSNVNPFGLLNIVSYSTPVIADLDGDGDLDILAGRGYGDFVYFENSGSATFPDFSASAVDPFGLSGVGGTSVPPLGDLDGDGDLDLLVGEVNKELTYFENVGDANNPSFATGAVNPFGFSGLDFYSAPAFADLDGDGDLDVISGEVYGGFIYFANTGDPISPAFTSTTTPVGLTASNFTSTPSFGDLDGDGDLELVAGNSDGGFRYFEIEGAVAPNFRPESTPNNLVNVDSDNAPAFGDLDGDLDILIGNISGNLIYFKNSGSATYPDFSTSTLNPFGLTTTGGSYSNPTIGDLDNDGDLDILVADDDGDFYYYENTGTATSPAFLLNTSETDLFSSDRYISPAFGDLDGDGDLDIIAGNAEGGFKFYENDNTLTDPSFLAGAAILSTIGTYSIPALADLDGDGDLDVIAGDNSGNFSYFENTGSATFPDFSSSVTLATLLNIGAYSAPALGDLDGDGDLDIIAGNGNGDFSYFVYDQPATIPIIDEGDRIVLAISKNSTPTAFALDLNVSEDLTHDLSWSVRLDGVGATAVGSGTPKSILYTPNVDFTGTDVFIIEVANEHGQVDSTTIIVHVIGSTADSVSLRNGFNSADIDDSDGLTLTEARTIISGFTQLNFDAIDGDGELSMEELLKITLGSSGETTPVYVNFANASTEDGNSPATGFNTLLEGTTFVTEGGTVTISAGSTTETIYIPKAMNLEAPTAP